MAKERWITINGTHVLIKDGQSVNDFFKDKKSKKRLNKGKYEYSSDEGKTWEDMDEDTYKELEAEEDEFDDNIDEDFDMFERDDFEVENVVKPEESKGKRWQELESQVDEMREFLIQNIGTAGDEKNFNKTGEELHNEWIEALKDKYGLSDIEAKAVVGKAMDFSSAGLEQIANSYNGEEPQEDIFSDLKSRAGNIETDGDRTSLEIDAETALEDGKITKEQYDELFNNNEEPQKNTVLNVGGPDDMGRYYVQDETGYRQYFNTEDQARNYAQRIGDAHGTEEPKEESDNDFEKMENVLKNKLGMYESSINVSDFNPDMGYMRFYISGNIPPDVLKKELRNIGLKKTSFILTPDGWEIDLNLNQNPDFNWKSDGEKTRYAKDFERMTGKNLDKSIGEITMDDFKSDDDYFEWLRSLDNNGLKEHLFSKKKQIDNNGGEPLKIKGSRVHEKVDPQEAMEQAEMEQKINNLMATDLDVKFQDGMDEASKNIVNIAKKKGWDSPEVIKLTEEFFNKFGDYMNFEEVQKMNRESKK